MYGSIMMTSFVPVEQTNQLEDMALREYLKQFECVQSTSAQLIRRPARTSVQEASTDRKRRNLHEVTDGSLRFIHDEGC